MNLRILLQSTFLLVLSGTAASAATVSITVSSAGSTQPKFVDSIGSFLSAGSAIRVGFFDISVPATLTTLETSNSYSQVNALFTPLAESIANAGNVVESGTTGTNIVINNFNGTGNVFGQIQNIDSTYCTPGTELAVWVFNNSDPTQATEWGIFTTSSGWEFPNATGSSTLATSEINDIIRGSGLSGNYALSSISVVPEPGSWLLLMLGAVVLNYRRRRHGNMA